MGGTTMLPGFVERLNEELRKGLDLPHYAPLAALKEYLKFHKPPAKANYTAWLGGQFSTSLMVQKLICLGCLLLRKGLVSLKQSGKCAMCLNAFVYTKNGGFLSAFVCAAFHGVAVENTTRDWLSNVEVGPPFSMPGKTNV